MPLSEHEQRLLDEMERSLYQNDGDVVASVGARRGRPAYRSIVIGALLGVAGIAALIVGVFLQAPIIGILGFGAMLAGVLVAISPSSHSPSTLHHRPTGKPSAARPQRAGFMDRLGDRWDRRQDGH